MNSKAIKRQLLAAIAMVLVAAVALGSSTYAWFVSNNTVKATTASISAQSNAPFLKIAKVGETLTGTSATQVAGNGDKLDLYPSQWNHVIDTNTYQFESAYASAPGAPAELANSRFAVGGLDSTYRPDYALKQSFDIGTTDGNAGSFQNLKVANVAIDAGANSSGLVDAMCVLVVCGNNWGVYQKSADPAVTDAVELTAYADRTTIANKLTGKTGTSVTDAIADTINANDKVTVDVYVFYDGSASGVFSNNLPNLKNCGVTITFTATPVNTQGNAVNAPNAISSAVASFSGNVLSVSVANAPTDYDSVSYSWTKDGSVVSTSDRYTLSGPSDDGSYTCTVTYTKSGASDIIFVSNAVTATYST